MKRILQKLSIVLVSMSSVLFVASTPVSAAEYVDLKGCNNGNFLGLISWCNGVGNINSEETLKTNIWRIAANVGVDITALAAYLVVGFVIYGGYLYLLSGGEASKVAAGKKTIANAFIGLGIVLAANIIFNSLRFILIGGNKLSECNSVDGCITPPEIITSSIQWVVGIAGLVAVIFLVIGGISYMTSSGEAAKIEKAKKTILYAIIGLGIVALAEIITGFVSGMLREANKAALQPTTPDQYISYQISPESVSTFSNNNYISKQIRR